MAVVPVPEESTGLEGYSCLHSEHTQGRITWDTLSTLPLTPKGQMKTNRVAIILSFNLIFMLFLLL